jgi:hypothetical protein
MSTIHCCRTVFSVFVAAFAITLAAPIAVHADDEGIAANEQVLAAAPVSASWDETSGYGSVEASRATIGHPATSMIDAAEFLAQFRAVELFLSRDLGAEQQVSSCVVGS